MSTPSDSNKESFFNENSGTEQPNSWASTNHSDVSSQADSTNQAGQAGQGDQSEQTEQIGQPNQASQASYWNYSQPGVQPGQYNQAGQANQYQQYGGNLYASAQPGVQPYSPYSQPSAPSSNNLTTESKGFFGALFDFSFRRFVTIDFVKIIYVICVSLYALIWAIMLIASLTAFSQGFGSGLVTFLGAIVLGGLIFFLGVVGARVALEFFASMVRTAQNTSELVDLSKREQR